MRRIYLVFPSYEYEDETLIAAFDKESEAVVHRQAREAAGESDLSILAVPFFSGEMPKSIILHFEKADVSEGVLRGHHKWSRVIWPYQSEPVTRAKAKVVYDNPLHFIVAGTDEGSVKKMFNKEKDKRLAAANR